MGSWSARVWVWRLFWRRVLFQWEENQLHEFYQVINSRMPVENVTDKIIWKWDKTGVYNVRSLTEKFMESQLNEVILPKSITILYGNQRLHQGLSLLYGY